MARGAQLYGVPIDALEADPRLHERRLDLAHSAASVLDKNNLIKYDRRSGNFQARRPALVSAWGCGWTRVWLCSVLVSNWPLCGSSVWPSQGGIRLSFVQSRQANQRFVHLLCVCVRV